MKTNLMASLLALTLTCAAVSADDQALLIANAAVPERIDKEHLEAILLGKVTLWENGKRILIAYSMDDPQKVDAFLTEYAGQGERRYKKYWVKKVFAGYGVAPKLFNDDAKALEYVLKTEGVMALVSMDVEAVPKELTILSVEAHNRF
ncbi:MAG: hypothetical protein JXK05_00665 [Campylobacterales bacterium]|nr:hypothetical protein [Campylobacterales bacterium]